MKRTLSLVLALVMVLGTFTGVFAAETATVDAGKFLEKVGVLEGDDNGNLMLDKTLLRRDMVVLVSRLMDAEEVAAEFPAEGVLTFEDITDAYYNGFIAWSVANKIIEGHDAKTFGFNENVTAQQFATVLLRVMGKEVKDADYPKVLETAKALGLLADVTVENATEITRAQMAAMTLNALKAENGKLAKELDIELPEAPKATELTAQVNDTENLAEIVVELSNADLADTEKLENASNYKLSNSAIKVKTAKVVGDNVVLTLAGEKAVGADTNLSRGISYTLTIRGIDRAINKDYKFRAYDNAAPAIESVEVLGEYGIKVTTTEPIDTPQERNFLVDGKNVPMIIEQYGRVLILTPYYDGPFAKNAAELTILELKDYAGYSSTLLREEIEIVNETEAPEVANVYRSRDGKTITVEFNEAVFKRSVTKYSNYRNLGNISYKDGRVTRYANDAKKIAENVAQYTFKTGEELPRNAEITIEGVKNHSGIVMEKYNVVPTLVLDPEVAEVINNAKMITLNPKSATEVELVVKFDKKIADNFTKTGLVYDNFTLYRRDTHEKSAYSGKNFITNAVLNEDEDELTLTFNFVNAGTASPHTPNDATESGLRLNNSNRDYDYILEVHGLKDAQDNTIARSYIDFEVVEAETFSVNRDVYVTKNGSRTDFEISFTERVDQAQARDMDNYILRNKNDVIVDHTKLDATISISGNGKFVTLSVVKDRDAVIDGSGWTLELNNRLRSLDGTRITSGSFDTNLVFTFTNGMVSK